MHIDGNISLVPPNMKLNPFVRLIALGLAGSLAAEPAFTAVARDESRGLSSIQRHSQVSSLLSYPSSLIVEQALAETSGLAGHEQLLEETDLKGKIYRALEPSAAPGVVRYGAPGVDRLEDLARRIREAEAVGDEDRAADLRHQREWIVRRLAPHREKLFDPVFRVLREASRRTFHNQIEYLAFIQKGITEGKELTEQLHQEIWDGDYFRTATQVELDRVLGMYADAVGALLRRYVEGYMKSMELAPWDVAGADEAGALLGWLEAWAVHQRDNEQDDQPGSGDAVVAVGSFRGGPSPLLPQFLEALEKGERLTAENLFDQIIGRTKDRRALFEALAGQVMSSNPSDLKGRHVIYSAIDNGGIVRIDKIVGVGRVLVTPVIDWKRIRSAVVFLSVGDQFPLDLTSLRAAETRLLPQVRVMPSRQSDIVAADNQRMVEDMIRLPADLFRVLYMNGSCQADYGGQNHVAALSTNKKFWRIELRVVSEFGALNFIVHYDRVNGKAILTFGTLRKLIEDIDDPYRMMSGRKYSRRLRIAIDRKMFSTMDDEGFPWKGKAGNLEYEFVPYSSGGEEPIRFPGGGSVRKRPLERSARSGGWAPPSGGVARGILTDA